MFEFFTKLMYFCKILKKYSTLKISIISSNFDLVIHAQINSSIFTSEYIVLEFLYIRDDVSIPLGYQ